jgi:hypothetical protein
MSIKFFGKAAAMAVAAAFIFTACSEEQAPVQNSQQGEADGRTPGLMKTMGTQIATLNPATDPGGGVCATDYTTGGMGQPAVWVSKSYDLSAWAGKNVRITFNFDTRDGNYNKHEGWYVDDINVDGITDDVESGAGAWTSHGYWHISTNRSVSGSSSWYYANSTTGNFQGANINSDCSDQRNSGTLTSGVIGLGANPTLTFNTLFAIEGVQPDRYDIMSIEVEEVADLTAAIDVKPGGCPNPFNVKAKGTLPVAILGTTSFDVTDVNASSVTLAGVMNGPQSPSAGDVGTPYGMMPMDCMDCNASGADGFADWTFFFASPDVTTAIGMVDDGDCHNVMLRGRLVSNGAWFSGYDVLKIIKKGK